MAKSIKQKIIFIVSFLMAAIASTLALANVATSSTENISTLVAHQLVEKARANTNWKVAFVTGRHEQIVFMNVSPDTNPNNEIGMETHPFDQVILIADGNAKAILNGKESMVNPGTLIFIPLGTPHNVINMNRDKPLKIISFYSSNDIPVNSIYKTKADEAKH